MDKPEITAEYQTRTGIAANTYLPANHKGSNFSSFASVGIVDAGGVLETNVVTTADGEYQIFLTSGGCAATTGAAVGISQGYIEGNFETTSQFTGNAIQVSGWFNLLVGAGADAWVGLG